MRFALSSYRLRATSGIVNVTVTYFGPNNHPLETDTGTLNDGTRKSIVEITNEAMPSGARFALLKIDNSVVLAPAYAANGDENMDANDGESLSPGTYLIGGDLDAKFVSPATPSTSEKQYLFNRSEAKAVSSTPLRVFASTNWTAVEETTNFARPRKLNISNASGTDSLYIAISSGVDNNNKVSASAGMPLGPGDTILGFEVPAGSDVFVVRLSGSANAYVEEYI